MSNKLVSELLDGDRFSADGLNWHTCAVVLFDSVAVYLSDDRGDDAPTFRIDLNSDDPVIVDDGCDLDVGWRQLHAWLQAINVPR